MEKRIEMMDMMPGIEHKRENQRQGLKREYNYIDHIREIFKHINFDSIQLNRTYK